MSTNPRPSLPRRGLVAAASLLIGFVVVAILFGGSAAGPSAGGTGPTGTLALRRLLEGVGHQVIEGDGPRTGEAFVLLSDRRDQEGGTAVLRWVADGGLLILADPRSWMLNWIQVERRSPVGLGGPVRTAQLEGECLLSRASQAITLEVRASDLGLKPNELGQLACYDEHTDPFAVLAPFGNGIVVVLGGRSPFENALLERADNAAFAAGLVSSRHVVRFGSARGPVPPTPQLPTSDTVWGALPTAARVLLIQLAVALVAFALFRGRRLGRPLEEAPLSPIPAGELVRATSRLYRKGRAIDFSGSLLRRAAEATLRRRLRLPRGAPASQVAEEAARATGRNVQDVLRPLEESPLRSDDDLIALGRELEQVQRTVETAVR